MRLINLRLWICLLISIIIFNPVTWADDFELGMQASNSGEHKKAAELWTPLANQGDRFAQFSLATLYHEGKGVPQDNVKATHWFRAAAEQGLAPAQFNLGNAYLYGRGIKKDYKQALEWWRKAAIQNMAPAQFNLGNAYMNGHGVDKDVSTALKWFQRAATNGHPAAQQKITELQNIQPDTAMHENTSQPQPAAVSTQGAYVIQLLAGSRKESIHSFTAQHKLQEHAVICKTTRNGQPLYVLLYGNFANYSGAKKALNKLPRAVQNNSPWIRKFSSLNATGCS